MEQRPPAIKRFQRSALSRPRVNLRIGVAFEAFSNYFERSRDNLGDVRLFVEAPLHALYHRNRFMALRVRALPDFLSVRFAQVSDQLEALPGLPPAGPAGKTTRRLGL
jgi:hypothetical protein